MLSGTIRNHPEEKGNWQCRQSMGHDLVLLNLEPVECKGGGGTMAGQNCIHKSASMLSRNLRQLTAAVFS